MLQKCSRIRILIVASLFQESSGIGVACQKYQCRGVLIVEKNDYNLPN